MYSCSMYFLPARRKLFLSSHLVSFSISCAAQEAGFSSDDSASAEFGDYDELKQRMQRHAAAGSIRKALETLNFMRNSVPGKPTVYDYNSMIKCHFKSGNVALDDLSEVHIKMKKFGPRPNLLTYQILLNGYISVGRLTDAILISKEMVESGFLPSYSIMSKLLKKVLKVRNVEGFDVFEIMLRVNIIPSQYDIDALIQGLCKVGMIQKAYSVFLVFSEKEYSCKGRLYKPSLITYTLIVKFLCDSGEVDDALSLLAKMEEEGCDPDLVTYNIVLRELCHQGRSVEIDDLLSIMYQKGLLPDMYTLSALGGGMLKRGNVEKAHKFLHDIISSGCINDDVIYNIYLHAVCCKGGSSEDLSIMLGSMIKKGFRPTNATYNTILKRLCQEKNMVEARKLFDRDKWRSDSISFNIILSAACKLGDSDTIRWIFREMVYEGINFDVVSWTCMIKYYCNIGRIEECLEFVNSMMIKGHQPNTITFNTLLIGLCKNRLLEMAEKEFDYFKRIGVSPNTATYNILIWASTKEDNDLLVNKFLRDMNSQKLRPDVDTYGCLIYSICKGGKLSPALRLLDQMRQNGIFPNNFIYNTIMALMLVRGMFCEIFSLLKYMAMDGCEPNKHSFDLLNSEKIKVGRKSCPRALQILGRVMHDYLIPENGTCCQIASMK